MARGRKLLRAALRLTLGCLYVSAAGFAPETLAIGKSEPRIRLLTLEGLYPARSQRQHWTPVTFVVERPGGLAVFLGGWSSAGSAPAVRRPVRRRGAELLDTVAVGIGPMAPLGE